MADKIIIADDHPIFRDGMCRLLGSTLPDAQLVEAETMDEVLELAQALGSPDLFVLDLLFPGMNPPATLQALRQAYPSSSIIIVSMLDDDRTIEQVMAAGIDGYIVKSIPAQQMMDALMAIRAGQYVVARPGLASLTDSVPTAVELKHLTSRQLEILSLVRAGESNKQIARKLDLSHFTVRNHISLLLRNFNAHSRSELASKAANVGCLSIPNSDSSAL